MYGEIHVIFLLSDSLIRFSIRKTTNIRLFLHGRVVSDDLSIIALFFNTVASFSYFTD